MELNTGYVYNVIRKGTGEIRKDYLKHNDVGNVATSLWDDPAFTLGIEYGMLILADMQERLADG